MDTVSTETRSRMMAAVKGKDTRPEMAVRKTLHAMGFRFRLHDRKLPGRPDIVMSRHRLAIFVNGCFWHGHDCPVFRLPASRTEFWSAKIETNRARDARSVEALLASGWRVLTIWECALAGKRRLAPEALRSELLARVASETADAPDLRGCPMPRHGQS